MNITDRLGRPHTHQDFEGVTQEVNIIKAWVEDPAIKSQLEFELGGPIKAIQFRNFTITMHGDQGRQKLFYRESLIRDLQALGVSEPML